MVGAVGLTLWRMSQLSCGQHAGRSTAWHIPAKAEPATSRPNVEISKILKLLVNILLLYY